MTAPDPDLAAMAQTLEQSGAYRVLRRLPFRQHFSASTELTKVAILLDVETTGLNTTTDEVVELGMVKFSYQADGSVGSVLDTFCSFNEPSKIIPDDAIKLHGITNDMVAGHQIDGDAIEAFAADAAVVIAHNAGFDRKFAERYWKVLRKNPGPVRSTRSSGARTVLRDRGWVICWAASVCFTARTAPSMIAMRYWKFWRIKFPRSIAPLYRCCWKTPAERPSGSGLNRPRSTSRIS
jgi:hypothetical protein